MSTVKINILEPIWKDESVGLDLAKCAVGDTIEVQILYKNIHGVRVYPFVYTIPAYRVKEYPTQMRKGGKIGTCTDKGYVGEYQAKKDQKDQEKNA